MSLYAKFEKQVGDFALSVHLEAGDETLGLLGASGCGKSMTLRSIAGIVRPDRGRIVLNGRVLFDSEAGIDLPVRRRNVGLLFQSYALFPQMTVLQNIASGVREPARRARQTARFLSLLRLEGLERRYPHQLSGGQQQRVALARMMAAEPEILMLDEPFSALDAQLRHTIEPDFTAALAAFQGTVLYVSHSINEVFRFCDSTAAMCDGQVVEQAPTKMLFAHPRHIETAKLLCVRNIADAEPLGGGVVFVPAWNVRLRLSNAAQDCTAVGIHMEDAVFCDLPGENSFSVALERLEERPRHVIATVRMQGAQETLRVNCDHGMTERLRQGAQKVPRYLCLPAEKIIPLYETN